MAAVPPIQNESNFESAFRAYHDSRLPCDTLTYVWVLRRVGRMTIRNSPPNEDEVALLLNGYLRHWGGMSRFLGGVPEHSQPDPFQARVQATLRKHWQGIHKTRVATNLTAEAKETIMNVMNGLIRDFRKSTKKGERRSGVAAGKLLHILLPNLGIIWDNQYVLSRGLRTLDGRIVWFRRTGGDYVRYIVEKFDQFKMLAEELKTSEADLAKRVVISH